VKIIKITRSNFNKWLDLALRLWPDQSSHEMQESLTNILNSEREAGFLVGNDDGKAMGFINISLRSDYVSGATSSPVAYVEGIYVKDEYRNQGVGKYLIEFASRWALENGCTELASDALIENTASYDFHTKVGFQEVERVVTNI
jgi:aminoglycoside 6'-N-acetyltransferase I